MPTETSRRLSSSFGCRRLCRRALGVEAPVFCSHQAPSRTPADGVRRPCAESMRHRTTRLACSADCQPQDCGRGALEIGFMHEGFERRITPRHRSLKTGVIGLQQDSLVECRICDFSPAGVGLIQLDADNLLAEFDLSFDYATRHCVTVWRAFNRIGLKYRSPTPSRVP
jgi:hypothetical protein